jgi:hypothetical protein
MSICGGTPLSPPSARRLATARGLRTWLAGREFWQGWTVNPEVRADLIALDGQDQYMTHAAPAGGISVRQRKAIVARPPVERQQTGSVSGFAHRGRLKARGAVRFAHADEGAGAADGGAAVSSFREPRRRRAQ